MRLVKRAFRFLKGQTGFTLIEALVAVGVLAAIGVVFMASMNTAYRNVGVLDEQTQAEALARCQLEQIKDAPYPEDATALGTDVYLVTVDIPFQYSMVITVVRPTCIGEKDDCIPIEEFFPGEVNVKYIQEITVSVFRTDSDGDRHVFSLSCYKSKVE